MPRRNPLSEQELAICRRVRDFRLATKLSRVAFGSKAGLDATLLASYEHGRARLNYAAAWKILCAFHLNPQWLATGEGRSWLSIPIRSPEELTVTPRAPFSQIYEDHLASEVAQFTKEWESKPPPEPLRLQVNDAGPRSRLALEASLIGAVKRWILCVPDSKLTELVNDLYLRGTKLIRAYPADPVEEWEKRAEAMERTRAEEESRKRLLLTDVTVTDNVSPVKSTMANLLDRLNKATSQRGMKSKLAKVMGVPLSNVSQWLSGEREPGGETTLRLLQWVERQAGQQKSPGGVEAPPEPKTQPRKSSDEKPKPGPKRR